MPRKTIDSEGPKKWVNVHSPTGLNYQIWRQMREDGVSVSSLAKTWHVTWNVMRKWMDKDDAVNGKPHVRGRNYG